MKKILWTAALLWMVGCGDDKTPDPEVPENSQSNPCAGLEHEECDAIETCSFTTKCVQAPTEAECWAMNEEQCLADSICRPKYGQVMHEEKYCVLPTFFSCERYERCNSTTALYKRDDGVCAFFHDDCMPSVGDWTQGPNGGYDITPTDCGVPEFIGTWGFEWTCMDWGGPQERAGMPTQPQLLSENLLNFGSVEVGNTATLSLEIVNVGTPATITEIEVEGTNFAIETIELPVVVEQGESLIFEVSVTASSTEAITGSVKIVETSGLTHEVAVHAN